MTNASETVKGYRETILDTAISHVKEMYAKAIDIFAAKAGLRKQEAAIAARESGIYSKVCLEVKEDGKPKYSNDTAREAAAAVIVAQDAVLVSARSIWEKDMQAIYALEASAESLRQQVSLYRAYLHGGGGE